MKKMSSKKIIFIFFAACVVAVAVGTIAGLGIAIFKFGMEAILQQEMKSVQGVMAIIIGSVVLIIGLAIFLSRRYCKKMPPDLRDINLKELNQYNIKRLKWSLQALVRPSKEQLSLYPDFVSIGDELVLEFDQHFKAVRNNKELTLSELHALNELDDFLEKHSGVNYQRMYLEPTGLNEPEWNEIRKLAKAALNEFGWEDEIPPKERGDFYIK
jgi:hypothetical protein